jgi:geranylgeranyl reductase family protein
VVDTKIYDVLIVGAGPAGTAVANAIKDSELSFILIDKESFPRKKPCAGVLPPRIYSELDIPKEIRERELNGYRLFSPSGTVVESIFPKPGLFVNRERFDEFLVKSLGLEITQERASKLVEHPEYIEVIGNSNSYKTKIVIGADGVNSIVRKNAGISLETVATAAQYEITIPEYEIENRIGNWFEVHYTIPYGYGWISPLKNTVKVGVGGVSPDLMKNTKKYLDEFLVQPQIKDKIGNGKINNFELHRIPMSGPLDQLVANRQILVGDAGGFVYPGTGEGIYYAIKSGRLAGEVIVKALHEQRFDQQFLEKLYTKELKANGLLSLRDVDFVERVLSNSENVERYLLRLKKLTHQ